MTQPVRSALSAALLVCLASSGSAIEQAAPEGWKWLTDSPVTVIGGLEPKPGEFTFTTMAPGWHITSRPAATLFEPTVSATGRYAVESEVFLFPGTSAEGFGVFVGGRDLEGVARYLTFLIRRDGSAAVERRDGAKTTALSPWTRHAAITPHPGGDETARNVLRIEAEAAQVAFLVNGTKVLDVPREPGLFDGQVGLRIGADLNLHITNLDVTRRLALPRRGARN
jgi:hypothetical protein